MRLPSEGIEHRKLHTGDRYGMRLEKVALTWRDNWLLQRRKRPTRMGEGVEPPKRGTEKRS